MIYICIYKYMYVAAFWSGLKPTLYALPSLTPRLHQPSAFSLSASRLLCCNFYGPSLQSTSSFLLLLLAACLNLCRSSSCQITQPSRGRLLLKLAAGRGSVFRVPDFSRDSTLPWLPAGVFFCLIFSTKICKSAGKSLFFFSPDGGDDYLTYFVFYFATLLLVLNFVWRQINETENKLRIYCCS